MNKQNNNGWRVLLLAVPLSALLLWLVWADDKIDPRPIASEPVTETLADTPVQPALVTQAAVPSPKSPDIASVNDVAVPVVADDNRPALPVQSFLFDSAAPPIRSMPVVALRATAEQIADPELYQHYEQQQDRQLKQNFVDAAALQVAELQQWLARGRKAGLSAEQLAEAEQKIVALQALSVQLQQQLATSQ